MEESRFADCPATPVLAMLENQELFAKISCSDFLDFQFGGKTYKEQLHRAELKSGQFCGVSCWLRNLNGIHCLWMKHSWDFIGGSLGCAEGEKLCLGFEYAREHRIPVVVETRSGGVRMQEGTLALMQMARVSVAVRAFKALKVPYVSVFQNPTYGGTTASYSMQGDVRIGVSNARVGFAGPNVILNTIYHMNQDEYDRKCPTGFQTAEFLLKHGQLDLVASDDDEVKSIIANLLWLLYYGRKINAEKRKSRSGHKRKASGRQEKDWPYTGGDMNSTGEQGSFQQPRSPGDALSASSSPKEPRDEGSLFGGDHADPVPMEVVPPMKRAPPDYTLARAADRYQTRDLLESLFTNFIDLSGDGKMGSDNCMHGGLAQFDNHVMMVIGTFKGHSEDELEKNNYGMASPHGYRTALRLMNLAEHFEIPVLTLVDTCGAYPTFDSEQEGQAEAIATNLERMAGLSVPIVTLIVGEGGSGGALGISMGDRIGMLSRAYYTVISPEGAASILGRYLNEDQKRSQFPKDCKQIAETQRIYATDLLEMKIIDEIVWEECDVVVSAGGQEMEASRGENYKHMPHLLARIRAFINKSLKELSTLPTKDMLVRRYLKFREMGKSGEVTREELDKLAELSGKPAGESVPPQTAGAMTGAGDAILPALKKLLSFIAGETISSAHSAYAGKTPQGAMSPKLFALTGPTIPTDFAHNYPKWILDNQGPAAVVQWMRHVAPHRVLVTDTTMRDAHQSLLATRIRTVDMLGAAYEVSRVLKDAFSLEVWGGATFDVCLRFLHEDPWERLAQLRKRIPNIMLQMLLRGSNAVGYASYPDNVIERFVQLAAKNGIDVFRVFDCFNSIEQMEVAIEAVKRSGKLCEVGICFSGNFMSPDEKIYTLEYFKDLARRLDGMGVHIIGIKDMAGLVRPQMAEPLLAALRSVTDLPIHFHTHNTSSAALTTCINMARAGCNVVDLASAALSDTTSQPNLNAFCAAMEGMPRAPSVNWRDLEALDMYWASVRRLYEPFESGLKAGSPRVYEHQIPGGQYSNLFAQCKSMGNWDRWEQVLDMYRDVNAMLGDIIKVTPSSKVVGDLALFMISKGLTPRDVIEHGEDYSYPQSVVQLFKGQLGRPHHGLPNLKVLPRGEVPLVGRPGKSMPPADFDAEAARLQKAYVRSFSAEEVVSSLLYPKVFVDYLKWHEQYGEWVFWLPSVAFFYGMPINGTLTLRMPTEDVLVLADMDNGASQAQYFEQFPPVVSSGNERALTVLLSRVGPLLRDSMRTVVFRVNNVKREITVQDKSQKRTKVAEGRMADLADKRQIAASIPGTVEKVFVMEGQKVHKGDKLFTISAMKLEVALASPFDGVVVEVAVKAGDSVHVGNLLAIIEPSGDMQS